LIQKIFITALLVSLRLTISFAQTTPISSLGTSPSTITSSAYSVYGLGESTFNGTTENIGKGGLSTAVVNYFSPSFSNAATFSHNRLTTFQVGIRLSEKQQLTDRTKNWSNNGSLNYSTLAFPVNKWWGCGVGLIPTYAQGYDLTQDSVNVPFGLANYKFSGKGNINKLAFGNAINPFKWFSDSIAPDFSIGFGIGYMFGTNKSHNAIEYVNYNNLGYYNQLIIKENIYNGLTYNAGIIHKFKVAKKIDMSVGATYDFTSKLKTSKSLDIYNYITNLPVTDSVSKAITTDLKTTLPAKIGLGFTLIFNNNLIVGVDYKNEQWSKFQHGTDVNNLKNSNTYILGFEYNAHKQSGGFLLNTNYRLGFRYKQLPYAPNGVALDEKAVSIGFGLPIKRSFSSVNIGFEMAQRGTKLNGLIQENYFSAFVGITINDRWFIKQKYD